MIVQLFIFPKVKFQQDGAETIVPQQSAALESILRVSDLIMVDIYKTLGLQIKVPRCFCFETKFFAEAEAQHVNDGRLQRGSTLQP